MTSPAQEAAQELDRILGETVGEASLCWEPTPTGVFDTHLASVCRNRAYERVMALVTRTAEAVRQCSLHKIPRDYCQEEVKRFEEAARQEARHATLLEVALRVRMGLVWNEGQAPLTVADVQKIIADDLEASAIRHPPPVQGEGHEE